MIVSLHLPKTAGTSFVKALENHFGPALLKDYDDLPINTPPFERNRAALQASIHNGEADKFDGIGCIHGHFLPLKYLLLSFRRDLRFITWLRDPVERMLSHYHFWRKSYDPQKSAPLHKRVIAENWSLERFCLGPELKNVYCQFVWGFPLVYFDFIGITEFYNEDLAYFSKVYLGTNLETYTVNVGDKVGGKYQIDEKFRKQIETFHSGDMMLYKRALTKRIDREKRFASD